ncbi:MAG: formylglycine-generating enzyme family protein [Candidatus Glassbacteria bacterium]
MKGVRLTVLAALAGVWLAGCGKEEVKTPPENYTVKIPGSEIEFEMVYVPGGEFVMGSPEDEPKRGEDEGPQRKVRVKPYWIGKTEVTWEMYEQYAFVKDPLMLDAISIASPKINLDYGLKFWSWLKLQSKLSYNEQLDAISKPSPYYGDYYHGMGRGRKPAIGVSRLNARVYCEWLTKKTGQHYRLPTEAEWEYAARAGSRTTYPFGDDQSQLKEYAWYEADSDFETMEVGTRKPNAWGIHDMLGNVWEFCFDYYDPDYLKKLKAEKVNVGPEGPAESREVKASLRGGSWDDFPEELRPANRMEQLDWWNERDPQRPRGAWWLVDGNVVGFRLARSAE